MDSEDLYRLQKQLEATTFLMKSKVKYENAAIFYGYSKAGKSSVLNYIIDNELIGDRTDEFMPVFIKTVNNSSGPEIGLYAAAKTALPTRWENSKKLPGLALWDVPGFNNNDEVEDTIGAYSTQYIFKNVKSAKVILVVDINDVTNNRINSFVDLLHSVESLFNGNMCKCFDSIAVIFTKVPDMIFNSSATKEFIVRLLNRKLLLCTNIKISKTIKDFLEYLIHNQESIGLFKQAKLGPITGEIEVDIIKCLQNVKNIDEQILKLVKPNIGDKSKNFLHSIRQKLSYVNEFENFQKIVSKILDDNVKEFLEISEKNKSKEALLSINCKFIAQLDQLKNITNSNYSFLKKIDLLRIVIPDINKSQYDVDKLIEMLKILEFIDDLLNIKEIQMFDTYLNCILSEIIEKFDKIIVDTKFKLKEIDEKELEKHKRRIDLQHQQEITRLRNELEEIRIHNENQRIERGTFENVGHYVDQALTLRRYIMDFIRR